MAKKFTTVTTVLYGGALFLSGALASSREIMTGDAVEATELTDPPTASPVLCSLDLNAYCPPNTTCCPRLKKKSSRTLFDSGLTHVGVDAPSASEIVGYSCLMSWSSRFPQGPCCPAHVDEEGSDADAVGSGCAVGYTCAAASPASPPFVAAGGEKEDGDSLARGPHCRKDHEAHPVDKTGRPIRNEFERMPRYRTCPAFAREDIDAPHALNIPLRAASYHKIGGGQRRAKAEFVEEGDAPVGRLAYFTNMGPLAVEGSSAHSHSHEDVSTVVIGIHGSGRDAGSYLCAVIAAVAGASSGAGRQPWETSAGGEFDLDPSVFAGSLRRRRNAAVGDDGGDPEGTGPLVIAPWFLSPADGLPESALSSSSAPFLRWVDDAPVEHTFRYGAESIPADEDEVEGRTTISSYAVMDVLLETLCDRRNYPNLKRIVVAGHSAGGQFVHRWGMSSGSWCFGVGEDSATDLPSIRLVPANPRSYAYLNEKRYLPAESIGASHLRSQHNGGEDGSRTLSPFDELELRLPNESELEDCPEYNRYCWGLEDNPNLPAPYISANVEKLKRGGEGEAKGDNGVFCRYASRDVVYLSGERDTKHLGNQICDEDGYQGPSRRERSERFYASLQALSREGPCSSEGAAGGERGSARVHDRTVVRDVGHDHALVFQSPEGLEGMFS